MASEYDIISEILVDHYDTFTPIRPLSGFNRKFERPADGIWDEAQIFFGQPSNFAMGKGLTVEFTGFMQLDLIYPENAGDETSVRASLLARHYFPEGNRGWSSTQNNITVKVPSFPAFRGSFEDEEGFYRGILDIPFEARVRPA